MLYWAEIIKNSRVICLSNSNSDQKLGGLTASYRPIEFVVC